MKRRPTGTTGAAPFTRLKAPRTFHETVNAKPGQGNAGATDLLFAIYEPAVGHSPPAERRLTGSRGGKLFMLAPRRETAKYLANPTGGSNPDKKRAATLSHVPRLTPSAETGAGERAETQHIGQAFLGRRTPIHICRRKGCPVGQPSQGPAASDGERNPDTKKFNFSAKPIAKGDNQAGGLILKSFCARNRIIDGLDDGFIVKIVG